MTKKKNVLFFTVSVRGLLAGDEVERGKCKGCQKEVSKNIRLSKQLFPYSPSCGRFCCNI